MKRFIIVSILLIVSLIFPLPVAHATTDKAFTTVRLNKFGSVAIVIGNKFGFDISSFIIPLVEGEEKEIQTPDFFPGADFKSRISNYNIPQNKVDVGKFIPWSENNIITLTSLYGAILDTDAEHSDHPEATDCIISEDLETSSPLTWAPTHFWNGQFLNGMLGIRPVEPNDGNGGVNFNRPNLALAGMNPAEDCKKHDPGIDLRPLENFTPILSHFGEGTNIFGHEVVTIMQTVIKIINGEPTEVEEPETEPHKDEVILTKDQKQPWFNFMCNDYWCPGEETGDDSSNTAKTGGWTNFLLPPKDQEKVLAASLQPHDVEVLGFPQRPLLTSFDAFNQSQVGMKKAACYSTPFTGEDKNIQKDAALGGIETIVEVCNVKPAVCGEPPVFTGSSSCKQCSPNMSGWAEPGTVPGNKLPDNLIKMVEQVGEAFGVPPASILAAMYHEGAFVSTQLSPDIYQSGPFVGADNWTDANVIKWSTCGQTMPNCPLQDNSFANCHVGGSNSEQCSKAIVGTGVIPYWFWGTGGSSDIWNAVQKIDPSRTQETINPCNLLDSVAALGKALSMWGLYPRTPATCYNRPMTSSSAGTCSASSWSDDKLVQSHVGLWVGSLPFCPDGTMPPPPEFGNNSVDPTYDTAKVLNPYKAFSCK